MKREKIRASTWVDGRRRLRSSPAERLNQVKHGVLQDAGCLVVQDASVQVLRVYGAALVPGLLFGLIFWNLAAFWAADGADGLPTRFAWGAVAVVLGAAIMGTLSLICERRAGAGHGLGARQIATVSVRGGADLPQRVKVALLSLPAEIREADVTAGRYTADTPWGWGSSGEHVTVELTGDPAHLRARVSSRPRNRAQLLDYGRGRRNVNRVIEALQD